MTCNVGFVDGISRWHIEQVGTITVERYEHEGQQIEKVSYPGWRMRSIPGDPGAASIATTSIAYASGPDMVANLRIGGWSVQELCGLAASR